MEKDQESFSSKTLIQMLTMVKKLQSEGGVGVSGCVSSDRRLGSVGHENQK